MPAPTCGRTTKAASPDQRHAPEGHARALQVVDRLQERLLDQRARVAQLRRQQALGVGAHLGDHAAGDQRRRDRQLVRAARSRRSAGAAARPPRRRGGTRRCSSCGGRGAGRCRARRRDSRGTARPAAGRRRGCRTAPATGPTARRARRRGRARRRSRHSAAAPRGSSCAAHGRAEAVGADQQVARLRAAVGEVGRDAVARPAPRAQVLAQMIVLAPERGASAGRTGGSRRWPSAGTRRSAITAAVRVEHQAPLDRHAEVAAGVDAELGQRLAASRDAS